VGLKETEVKSRKDKIQTLGIFQQKVPPLNRAEMCWGKCERIKKKRIAENLIRGVAEAGSFSLSGN